MLFSKRNYAQLTSDTRLSFRRRENTADSFLQHTHLAVPEKLCGTLPCLILEFFRPLRERILSFIRHRRRRGFAPTLLSLRSEGSGGVVDPRVTV